MNERRGRAIAVLTLVGLIAWPAAIARGERLPLRNFTVQDGLPSNAINCIVRDRAGFVWFCTDEGLALYDGFVFRTFGTADGLPHRRVTAILPARDGSYWIGTDDGLVHFRPARRTAAEPRFTVVRPPAPAHWAPDRIIANRVTALLEDRSGRLWCGTAQAGLFVVETRGSGLALTPVTLDLPIDTWITALAESVDGTMWIGTSRGLIRRTPAGARAWFGHGEGLAKDPGVLNEEISSLLVHEAGLFVGTRMAGLHLLDRDARPGRPAVVRSWQTTGAQGGDRVYSLFAARDGHLWYGGAGGAREVVLDAAPASSLRIWGARAGLGPSNVTAVAEDAGGSIWIGTDGGGAFRLRRAGFTTFTIDDGLAGDQVKSLFLARGALHAVTANAKGLFLSRFNGQRFESAAAPYHVDPLEWTANQLAMYDRMGEWWLVTWQGVTRAPARSIESLALASVRRYGARDGLWSDSVYKVFEDSRGDVWLGTFAKLQNVSRWRRDTGQVERHVVRTFPYEEGFGFGFVPEVFAEAPDGAIWVGSHYGGVARHLDGRWEHFDERHGVPAGRVHAMLRDGRGRLWIGASHGGLARVDDPAASRPVFVPIRKADGLSTDHVLSLAEDLHGRIYLGTGLGIDRLEPDTLEVRSYDAVDGLAGGPVVAALRDAEGDLWFGTSQGLSRFRPSPHEDRGWPELRVTRVATRDLEVGLSDLGVAHVPALELQPHENAVQITVDALAAGHRSDLRFQARLEGTQPAWMPIAPGRPVVLPSLQPGTYRFVARATTLSGRSGPSSVSVVFTILRPWWLRPWALGLEALAVLAALGAAYHFRVRHLLAIERVRSRIASDLHDDVGASLSRMALLSEAARGHRGTDREAVALSALAEVASTARALAADMADIVWATDPHEDTVANVIARASWFGSELFALRGTEWRCVVDESAAVRHLGPEARRHLLLLLKETLNNIAKHAEARHASLEARVEDGTLVIRITDDGRGFDETGVRGGDGNGTGNGNHGHGLPNMVTRARALGGTCTVRSSPGEGCRIELRLPSSSVLRRGAS